MGSKSQRKKEQHARKRQEKRRKRERAQSRRQERQRKVGDSNFRHRERLAKQVPLAWPGELPEDVAIFDDATLATLSPEGTQEVAAVREALQELCASRFEDALKRVSSIARSSPLSEWRLFIRGLVDWSADSFDAASETWKRLNPERRPGRMATAMMLARRTDLEKLTTPPQPEQRGAESQTAEWSRWDETQLYHARLLRRVRFDRAALRVAEIGLGAPEEDKQLLIGPRKMEWMRRFIANHDETEPELVAAISQAALCRAYNQQFADLFDEAVRSFSGPRHDCRSRILTYLYYAGDPSSWTQRRAKEALDTYLGRELPQNESLTPSIRSAIASQIYLRRAQALLADARNANTMGPMGMFFGPQENTAAIREYLNGAINAYAANGPAYKDYVEWLGSKLEDDRLEKSQEALLEVEVEGVMQRWSQAVPEEVEPRLWLVDAFLEKEQLEEARPHVEFLAASRQDDPRVRAMPWKWQLLEAMRLCRRKGSLAEARARLEEAQTLWPAWLSPQWLPYLWAAVAVRGGQGELYEVQRERICQDTGVIRDSLTDACMMLGAAQRMRIPAAELKPFRAAVDRALAGLTGLPLDDLLAAGNFFWDLHRAQLVYPAYRMHGNKIGKELFSRLDHAPKLALERRGDERLQGASLWGSEYRFWPHNYEGRFPTFFADKSLRREPMYAAARVNAILKQRYAWGAKEHRDLAPLLREAAPLQRDAYYRYWFSRLAEEFEDVLAKQARSFGFVKRMVGLDEDDEDDYDDEDLGFDPDCDCATCRARRTRQQTHSTQTTFF